MTHTGIVIKARNNIIWLQLITALALLPALPFCYIDLVGRKFVALLWLPLPLFEEAY